MEQQAFLLFNSERLMIRTWIQLLCASCVATGFAQQSSSSTESSSPGWRSIDEWLLFYPTKHPQGDWNPEGFKFLDVQFQAADGTELHGWYCPRQNPRAHVLIAHGNAGNVTDRADWIELLQSRLGISIFMFDYRGFGRSEGTPTIEGVLQDARAARKKLSQLAKIGEADVVVMGESLGGAVAADLAGESAPKGLILQSTFSSLRDMADIHYPALSWLVEEDRLNSEARLRSYRGPLLQSHGKLDEVVPFALGRKLYESCVSGDKSLFVVESGGHNDWVTDAYLERLKAFLDEVSGAPSGDSKRVAVTHSLE